MIFFNNKNIYKFILIIFNLLAVITLVFIINQNIEASVEKTSGEISYEEKRSLTDKNIVLEPAWYILEHEFYERGIVRERSILQLGSKEYDKKHLPVEQGFEKRVVTLSSEFFLSEKLSKEDLSLFLGVPSYPFEVYLNNVLVYKKGRYKNARNYTIYNSSNVYLSDDLLNYGDDKINKIDIHLYSISTDYPLNIGGISTFADVSYRVFWSDFFMVNVVQISSGISLLLFLYFLFKYFRMKFEDKRYVYLACFCIFYLLSYVIISFSHSSSPEMLIIRISRMAFPLSASFLSVSVMEHTKLLNKHIWIKTLIISPSVGISTIIMFSPTYEVLMNFFYISIIFIIVPLFGFDIILLVISIFIKNKTDSLVVFISLLIIIGACVFDSYYIVIRIHPFAYLIPYSYLIFVFNLFFLLAREESEIFFERELAHQNLNKLTIKIHNSLKNKLESARNLMSYYLKTDNKDLENLKTVNNLILHCSKESKNILFVLKNLECSLKTFTRELELRTALTLAPIRAKYEFKFNFYKENVYFKTDVVQSILDIFTEIMNNIVKHSGADKVDIFIGTEKNNILLTVKDNGIGFDYSKEKDKNDSYGLNIIEKLVEEIDGDMTVKSETNKGSLFKIFVKECFYN